MEKLRLRQSGNTQWGKSAIAASNVLFSGSGMRVGFVGNKRIPDIWPGVLLGLTFYKLRFWVAITRLI